MEYIEDESKDGVYDVYLTPEGKKLYVLEGLSVHDQVASPPLQQYIHEHYAFISALYWIILGCTLIYLIGLHIFIPLMRRYDFY
jgi:hypothetical protein